MKLFTAFLFTYLSFFSVHAQNSSASSAQKVSLDMADVVSANLFSGSNGSGNSSTVNLPITGVNALASGIESAEIGVTLQCNTNYDVRVSAASNAFTYSGTGTGNTTMLVKDVLNFMIFNNNTGGTVANNFSQYQPIDGTTTKLALSSGLAGEHSFAFKYKAQPGFNYAAGTYTTDIVFTVVKK